MIALLIALATAAPAQCPIASPPYRHVGNTSVCWDGTNLWSPNGIPHKPEAKFRADCPKGRHERGGPDHDIYCVPNR